MSYERRPRPPRDAHWLPRKQYLAQRMKMSMLGTSPKELLANKFLGYDPMEVRQKGVAGTMTSTVIRALLGMRPPTARMPEAIAEAPEEEAQKTDSSRGIRRAMSRNTKAIEKMHVVLKQLLNEAIIIRKVTEGRVKFNPRSGGYTKELTTKEINKRAKAGLKGPTSSFMGISDLLTPAATEAKPAAKPWERKEDENNENKDRDTSIKEPVKATFGTSSIDEMSPDALENPESRANTSSAAPNPLGAMAGIASRLMGSLLTRGVLRRGAARIAPRVGGRILAKVGARGLGKAALKKIPLIGLAVGAGLGIHRMMKGDMLGAMGEVASGAASMIPGAGTAASVALDAGLIAHDMRRESRASVDRITPDTATGLEQDPSALMMAPPSVAQVVTNNYSGQQAAMPKIEMPDVRPTNNSFVRFQDSRQVRVL